MSLSSLAAGNRHYSQAVRVPVTVPASSFGWLFPQGWTVLSSSALTGGSDETSREDLVFRSPGSKLCAALLFWGGGLL